MSSTNDNTESINKVVHKENNQQHPRRSTKKKGKRKTKSHVITSRGIYVSDDPFVQKALEVSRQLDGDDVKALLRKFQDRGMNLGGSVDDFLLTFDWDATLLLLPFLLEYADTMKDAPGHVKEEQTIALIIKLVQLAGHEEFIDENAIHTLRLVIATAIDISKGKFELNAKTGRNALSAALHSFKWSLTHCCSSSS